MNSGTEYLIKILIVKRSSDSDDETACLHASDVLMKGETISLKWPCLKKHKELGD